MSTSKSVITYVGLILIVSFIHRSLSFIPQVQTVRFSDDKMQKGTNPLLISNMVAQDDIMTKIIFEEEDSDYKIPDVVEHVVLRQVYKAMLKNIEEYGNPNIPLGTSNGKKCYALRTLYQQDKLTEGEVDLLNELGFRFPQLEEVYKEADFDDIYERLKRFKKENPDMNMQIPKKYKLDPELGHWVALARREGPIGVGPDRRKKLEAIGFSWESERKCRGIFMTNYRHIRETVKKAYEEHLTNGEGAFDGFQALNNDKHALKWLKAQSDAHSFGNLSKPRVKYLDQLHFYNVKWREM